MGGEEPWRASLAREPHDGETEERAPPEQSRAPNMSSHRGVEGGGGPPTQKRASTMRRRGKDGGPNHTSTGPTGKIGTRTMNAPPSPSSVRKLREGGLRGRGRTPRIYGARADPR